MKLFQTPTPLLILGFAGLIPFWVISLIVLSDASVDHFAVELQVSYGAVILSFLGGIHWGMLLVREDNSDWRRAIWGVTPSLIGWFALALPLTWALITILAGLIMSALADLRIFSSPSDTWYRPFRLTLTLMAVSAILIVLISVA